MMSSDNTYFAAKPPKDLANILGAKASAWTDDINTNGYLEKLRACYAAFHGCYYQTLSDGHKITFSGEQGELVNIPVNQWRNIATHMHVITCSNRPAVQCRAANTDFKSLVETYLGNSILDYYFREKQVEVYLKQAVEYAIVYGAGFIVMEWDAKRGERVDYYEDTGTTIYEGDIVFENLHPFDVMYDGSKETGNHDWVLIRRWKNKFDLAAKYPEYADKIKGLQTKSDMNKIRVGLSSYLEETDDVQVLEFYHRKTDCMPEGRYMMFLQDDLVLQDLPIPYRVLPVFRIAPGNIHGTPYGYTPMFDLLPIQEGLNSLYSTILTNQNAFGVQNVLVPRGCDIAVNQLAGGLNVIEYNTAVGKPEPLNLTNTPAEVFKFLQMLEQVMETLSGINSVARGQPEPSLKSGTALALIQSMSLQFLSGLQQSYVELVEGVGSAIIKMLQDFADTPRIVAISGISNRNYVKEFSGKDISSITRVIVDVANPLASTTAGRVQMAEQLLQYQQINAQQYVNIINTGSLQAETEEIVKESFLMRAENEALINGETPQAVFVEDHKGHINFHRSVLFDPELKKDAGLVGRVHAHIQQHIELLKTTDPNLLMLFNQQPLPPDQPPPPQAPPASNEMMPPEAGQMGQQITNGRLNVPGMDKNVRLPNLPKVNPTLLPNPSLQAQSLGNLRQ